MDEIYSQIKTPAFWIFTVVVALFVNLASSILLRVFDRHWPEWSAKRKKKKDDEIEIRRWVAEKIRKNPEGIHWYQLSAIRCQIFSCTCLVAAFVSFTFKGFSGYYSLISPVFGGTLFLLFLAFARHADYYNEIVKQSGQAAVPRPDDDTPQEN